MITFRNEPLLELRRPWERDELLTALRRLDEGLPFEVPVIVGGDRRAAASFESVDPGMPDRTVARATEATSDDIDAAVTAAAEAGRLWGLDSTAAERAEVLARAAGELRGRRRELAALEVRECAKPWAEADADVCEAIDFLEYYAIQAVALDRHTELLQVPGERNSIYYRPRGVVAVVAPWNFPIAIAAGMTAAGLAVGNAVCLKPAEQSPACALALVDALHRAGVPAGALSLLPGGAAVGSKLVSHPGVHAIAFTGSGSVGREIIETAAKIAPRQHHIKHVVAEMGGKNCVIVDADADLDDAIPALLESAFGFAGQKCSALSRLLVHERVASSLLERLRAALDSLLVGQAEVFGTDVPPLIERKSCERVERVIAEASSTGATINRVREFPAEGFFATPALVAGAPAGSAVVMDEIFGPVLAVEQVPSVEFACQLVEAQPYALTGGIFSRNPRVIRGVVNRTPVGNFYINRATTGAMVARQPFGGNRLSGTGAKAGGADYLLQFVDPVVVSENTIRHGLAL